MRILLAEDERELSRALVTIFKHNKYSVDAVYNGQDALDYGLSGEYDCIVLDIMMPQLNGIEVLKNLREKRIITPIIMLTAKADIEDKVLGLDLGADDYLTKPFQVPELLARIRVLTRKREESHTVNLSMGNIQLNRASCELICNGNRDRMTNKEFQILELFLCNPNVVLSVEQLMNKIWGFESEAEINVVWTHISNIRKRLSQMKANVQIKAIRGVGYLLEKIDV